MKYWAVLGILVCLGQVVLAGEFVSRQHGFAITLPDGWIVQDGLYSETVVIKASLREQDGRYADLNIHAWEVETPGALAGYTPKQIFDQLYAKGSTLLASGITTLSGNWAVWLEMETLNSPVGMHSLVYAIEHGGKAYILTGITARGGGRKWYDTCKPVIQKAVGTFRFMP